MYDAVKLPKNFENEYQEWLSENVWGYYEWRARRLSEWKPKLDASKEKLISVFLI